jgi:hypothetical protein
MRISTGPSIRNGRPVSCDPVMVHMTDESALAQIAEERDESDLEECIGPLMQRFWSAIFETFFCFKHSAFEEEKEWRLVYPRFRIHNRTPQPDAQDVELKTQFRTKNGIVIPYVSINLPLPTSENKAIRGVMVGPSAQPELARQSVEMLLATQGYDREDAPVTSSAIPLRG